jgi:hypothetical protein
MANEIQIVLIGVMSVAAMTAKIDVKTAGERRLEGRTAFLLLE